MSQIGYMIMGVGIGAYDAGVFHFLTHAFFKAQLFLGAGIVIHALANEQDVRRMGGLRKQMPFAFVAMLVGVLAICGVPGLQRFLQQGRRHLRRARERPSVAVRGRRDHRRDHRVLHVPAAVRHVLRRVPRRRRSVRPRHPPSRAGRHRGELRPPCRRRRAAPPRAGVADVGPVAILIVPTMLIGWLDFGGANAPWKQLLRRVLPARQRGRRRARRSRSSSRPALVLVVVAIGFADRVRALRRAGARCATRSRACGPRRCACRRCWSNAYYFDAAYDALFVRPARAFGGWFDRVRRSARHRRRACARPAISSQWLGHLFRSFQTGSCARTRSRSRSASLCIVAYYYAFAFRRGTMTVAALVLGPIVAGLLLYARAARARARSRAALAAAVGGADVRARRWPTPHAPDASLRWLSRPFTASFHLGFGPISYWLVLLLALATFSGALALRRTARAQHRRAAADPARRDERRVSRQGPAAVRAVLGPDADPGVPGADRRRPARARGVEVPDLQPVAAGSRCCSRPPRSASSPGRPM